MNNIYYIIPLFLLTISCNKTATKEKEVQVPDSTFFAHARFVDNGVLEESEYLFGIQPEVNDEEYYNSRWQIEITEEENDTEETELDPELCHINDLEIADSVIWLDTRKIPTDSNAKLLSMVEQTIPDGVEMRWVYPKGSHKKYLDKINEFRRFAGGYSYDGYGIDSSTSDEELILFRNLGGTYVFNPHRKPLTGLIINTIDEQPMFFEGDSINIIDTVKEYFDIETTKELILKARPKIRLAKQEVDRMNAQHYKHHYGESNYKLSSKQIETLNKYVLQYIITPTQDLLWKQLIPLGEWKGKVKTVQIKHCSEGLGKAYDKERIFHYDRDGKLTHGAVYDSHPHLYRFSYNKDGMLNEIRCNYSRNSYKILTYRDSVVAAQLPNHFRLASNEDNKKVMHLDPQTALPTNATPYYHLDDQIQYTFNDKGQLTHYYSGQANSYNAHVDYSYKEDGSMHQIKTWNERDITYTYFDNRIELTDSIRKLTQWFEYDEMGNVLTSAFDKHTYRSESIDAGYKYKYYED